MLSGKEKCLWDMPLCGVFMTAQLHVELYIQLYLKSMLLCQSEEYDCLELLGKSHISQKYSQEHLSFRGLLDRALLLCINQVLLL